ncbi:MAG: YwqG family protein [Muribaculaceae bacterium]
MEPIYLKLSKPFKELNMAASRFWGNPALPQGVEYPQYIDDEGDEYPYVFICQINLADLKEFCGNGLDPLPPEGLLLFFAKIDHYLGYFADTDCIGGAISDPDAVKVMYFNNLDNLREVVLVDDKDQPMSPEEMEIHFTSQHEPLNDDDHCLFARPDHREWESWDHPYEDWQILLQIDSFAGMDFNLNFMDFGVLNFLISPDDLRRADFSNVRAIVLSS